MEARKNNLSRFLRQEDTRFFIPVYQRNYDWNKDQCEQLLIDILRNHQENTNKEYFIGSIVYTSRSQTTRRDIIIIDGQQRITTINLLLLAAARTLINYDSQLAEKIWQKFIKNEASFDNNKLKLKHNQKDSLDYENLITENFDRIQRGSRIYENYKYFLNVIKSPEIAIKIYEGFELLTFVEIGLDESDDAQKVFQGLNSTGLDLSQADLIRNYILMNHSQEKQVEIFNKYWSVIEDSTFEKGSLKTRTSYFFKDYITYKFSKIPREDLVFEEYRKRFDLQKMSLDEYTNHLEEIKSFSSYYNRILNPETIFDIKIQKEYKVLKQLEMSVTYPFLLGVFHLYETGIINNTDVISILRTIQSYIVRRFICNYGTNALRGAFASLFQNIVEVQNKFSELSFAKSMDVVLLQLSKSNTLTFPDNEHVLENLETREIYTTPSRFKNYFFEKLENGYSEFIESEFSFESAIPPVTIEHIFPQNPSKEWKERLTEEDYNFLTLRCNMLGNLTIVVNNSSLGNRTFVDKRDLNLAHSKGYRFSKFRLNETLINLETWDARSFQERQRILANKVLDVWLFPIVESKYIKEISEDIEIPIDEIQDVTFTKIKSVSIDGKRYICSSYREAYKNLLVYLYKNEPEIFNTPEFISRFKVTVNKNELISPLEISKELYAETNFSSNDLLNKMRKLLELTSLISDIRISFLEIN